MKVRTKRTYYSAISRMVFASNGPVEPEPLPACSECRAEMTTAEAWSFDGDPRAIVQCSEACADARMAMYREAIERRLAESNVAGHTKHDVTSTFDPETKRIETVVVQQVGPEPCSHPVSIDSMPAFCGICGEELP